MGRGKAPPQNELKSSTALKVQGTSAETHKLQKPHHSDTVALPFHSLINFPNTKGVAGRREEGSLAPPPSTATKDQTLPESGLVPCTQEKKEQLLVCPGQGHIGFITGVPLANCVTTNKIMCVEALRKLENGIQRRGGFNQ